MAPSLRGRKMKIWILLSLIPLTVFALSTPPTPKEAAYLNQTNKIINPGAENGTAKVTISAGTLTATTLSSELGMGARAFKWCPAASGNTLSFSQYVVETGLKGQNGEASSLAQTSGTNFALRVFDGSSVLGSTTTITPSSSFQRWTDNFVFPSSGSLTVNAIAGNPANCLFLDDNYLGKSTNIGSVGGTLQIISANQTDYGWTACTMTVSAVTTPPTKATSPAVDNCQQRRVNDTLELKWTFVANNNTGAASGSGTYLFKIPNSLTADSTVQNISSTPTEASVVAYGSWNNGSAREIPIEGFLYDSSSIAFRYLSASALGNPGNMVASANGFATSGSGWKMSFDAKIKISGWAANQRAPALVNSVISPYEGTARIVWASIANTGTPTVTRQSGTWISSITDNGTGDMTINITAGTFSVIPTCVITDNPNTDQGSQFQIYDNGTARSTTLVRLRTMNGASTLTDKGVEIMCMAPR